MTQETQNIIRWILLVPALLGGWFVANIVSMLMLFFLYGFSSGGESDFVDLLFWVLLFGLYVVAPFFITWGIAPRYKRVAGVCAVVVVVVLQFFVVNNI